MPELRTQIYAKNERKIYGIDDKYDEYTFTSFIIFYIVSFALWILNFYADKEPMKTKYPKSKVGGDLVRIFFLQIITYRFEFYIFLFLKENVSRIGSQFSIAYFVYLV